jgi:AAA15 family ATPase/GTPase
MERILHKVDPRVKKVRVDAADDGNQVLMDMGLSEMLPLTQAGQGMYRLVSMMAGLIGDRPNLALVDEMDDGIHHSVLADVWTGIAEAAELFGIQVFVTTHSYECIQAAHEAFSKRDKYDLGIIQLFRLKDHVEGRVLQKDQIEAAISGGIDLRS